MSLMNDEGLIGPADDRDTDLAWVRLDSNGQVTDSGARGGDPGPRLSDGDLLSRFDL